MACSSLTGDCASIGYLLDKIMHGSSEFTHPVGASFTESIGFTAFNYATIIDPVCRPMTSRDCAAVIESIAINPTSPNVAADAKGTLAITFKATDGNCHTINLANMKRGTLSGDMRQMPYTKTVDFVLEGIVSNISYAA